MVTLAVRRLTDGGGSSELKPKDLISPLDALRALYGDKIEYTQGYACGRPFFGHEEEMQQTVIDSFCVLRLLAKARQADVVIYVGGLNKNRLFRIVNLLTVSRIIYLFLIMN